MGEIRDTEVPATVTGEATVKISLDLAPTMCAASIHLGLPVLRSATLTNAGSEALDSLVISIRFSPAVIRDVVFTVDGLPAGGERRPELPPRVVDLEFLSRLDEATRATVTVEARCNNELVGSSSAMIDILAFEEWPGERAVPELLAAFCMPNHPAIDRLIGQGADLVRAQDQSFRFDGYQAMSREVVWHQVSALWNVLLTAELNYAVPPASFLAGGQKIRTPDRILDYRIGTCIDLTLLLAALLEQVGLRPVILVGSDHAWLGVWLHPTSFGDAIEDDVQAIRKRIASGELLAIETTLLTQGGKNLPTLHDATLQGAARLNPQNGQQKGGQKDQPSGLEKGPVFAWALDIHTCRELGFLPMASRVESPTDAVPGKGEGTKATLQLEPVPALPPLDPLIEGVSTETEATEFSGARLTRWKSRLLDLTLRNRLLNFRPSKNTLMIAPLDLGRLEDALADGAEFRFVSPPARSEPTSSSGQSSRSQPSARSSRGGDPLKVALDAHQAGIGIDPKQATDALAKGDLMIQLARNELDTRLQGIWRQARENIEEGGANTLFLALGFLEWTQSESAERRFLAPIVLVPVSLERTSVRSGYRLRRHDDEAIVNPTLLEHLRITFEQTIAGLDPLPVHEKGIDVANILQAVRLAVTERRQWEVKDVAWLGHFSFTKYLMWKDLEDRADALRRNDVVRHLIDHPGEPLPAGPSDPRLERLDDAFVPGDLLLPLLADSSQQQAVAEVDAGRNLVLEGPPGTGKSQTITNIIAHALGRGRSVLFVSEKMAALDVVRRRLVGVGLGAFCLELHSAKARKVELLRQLGETLELAATQTPEAWAREVERLSALRAELNALVTALHRRHPNGLTVFSAIGATVNHTRALPAIILPWKDPDQHNAQQLDGLRLITRRIDTLSGALGSVADHPLRLIGSTEWSATLQDEVKSNLDEAQHTLRQVHEAARELSGVVGFDVGAADHDRLHALAALAVEIPGAATVPPLFAARAADATVRQRLAALIRHGKARHDAWQTLEDDWTPELASQHAGVLRSEWSDEATRFWPRSWFGKRAIRKRLSVFRVDCRLPTNDQTQGLFDLLAKVNEEDGFLHALGNEASALLGEAWKGQQSSWLQFETWLDWANRFAGALESVVRSDDAFRAGFQNRLVSLIKEDPGALGGDGRAARAFSRFAELWGTLAEVTGRIAEQFQPLETPWGDLREGRGLHRLQGCLESWSANLRQLSPWCQWRKVREEAASVGLGGVVESVEQGAVQSGAVAAMFEQAYQDWWLRRTVDRDDVLRSFSRADHERTIDEFRQKDEEFQRLTEQWVAASLAARIPRAGQVPVGADSEMGILKRELAKQRRHLPVRQLVKSLPTLLPRLKPCLLMSPLSVAQYLDAGYAPFDLVVFDEASQIPVWDAIGVIARGTQVVVVGDPRQLPPTRFFDRDVEEDSGTGGSFEVDELESILDECMGAGMYRRSLTWHYRSRHESLISFSNQQYYDGRLNTFPSPFTADRAVRLEPVAGVYDRGGSRTNAIEAEAVVNAIETHYLASRNRVPSLGVVTFNQPQQALIEQLLDARRAAIPALDNAIAAASVEPLFIKNLENVQGDERDLILFSVTFGNDASGRMTLNFGPLNGEGGHRRLNVAITRAREAVVVFSSLQPEQIDLSRVRARGVHDLRHYLDYARARTLDQPIGASTAPAAGRIESAVAAALQERGFEVHHRIGASGRKIDLGVVDPRDRTRYVAAVECDGEGWRDAPTARDRERLRRHVLTGLGWTVFRVWSMEWWLDPVTVADRLIGQIRLIASKPLRETETVFARPARAEPRVVVENSPAPVVVPTQEAAVAVQAPVLSPAASPSAKVDANASSAPTRPSTTAGDGPIDRETMRAALQARIRARAARQSEAMAPTVEVANMVVPSSGLPIYKPAELRRTSSKHFNEPHAERLITTTLRMIIDAEGPVAESVLLKKASLAWGFDRTGPKVNQRLLALIPSGSTQTRDEEETFWWPERCEPSTWTGFRIAGEAEASRRSIYETAREEIVLIIRHVLDVSGTSSREDLARSVCRMVGMTRTTADAEARVLRQVDGLIEQGELEDSNGRIRIRRRH